jgi:hypothetical protein
MHPENGAAQANKTIIAFGGTGKTVALIYTKIGRLLGESPHVIIVDFPPNSSNLGASDHALDDALRAEGITDQFRINTLPDNLAAVPKTLIETLKIPGELADALFSKRQQETPPAEGLNAEPIVGASVAHWKIRSDQDAIRSKVLTGRTEMFYVGGLGGGTGTGVTIPFARSLRQEGIRSHGVFVLPWRDVGDAGQVTNSRQMRNACSLLRYIAESRRDAFDDVLILGGTPGMRSFSGDGAQRPVHASLILAALYIHMWHAWGGGAQLTEDLLRMETLATGVRLQDIKGKSGNLYDALIYSLRIEWLLREMADQSPDQKLSLFSMWPTSAPLSWRCLDWALKIYKQQRSIRDYSTSWMELRAALLDLARQEEERREWIVLNAANPNLFNFSAEQLVRDARLNFDAYRAAVSKSTGYRHIGHYDGTDQVGALSAVTGALVQHVLSPVLHTGVEAA